MSFGPVAAQAFGTMAEEYLRGRPGWPADAISALVARFGARTVLDLAAGTGRFTEVLASVAQEVVAVAGGRAPGRRRRRDAAGHGAVAGGARGLACLRAAERRGGSHSQPIDRDGTVTQIASFSSIAALPLDRRTAALDAARALLEHHGGRAAGAEAEAGGAERLCGGELTLPGLDAAFCAPIVLRGVRPDAQLLREMPPGPVLAVLEAASEREAIALAAEYTDGAVSVWAADRAHGERVARSLAAELACVNEHGQAVPSAPVRLARHVSPHRLATQPARQRSAR